MKTLSNSIKPSIRRRVSKTPTGRVGIFWVFKSRVLFMRPTRKYHVYMDKVLHNLKIKRALLKEFELSRRTTRFLMYAHYTTGWEDLQNLFT